MTLKHLYHKFIAVFIIVTAVFAYHSHINALSAEVVPNSSSTERGRVTIDPNNKTFITDNGIPLRGEHIRVAHLPLPDGSGTYLDRAYDIDMWNEMVEEFHLNTVRLLLYRPPQNWGGGPGSNCPVERCFATVQDALPHIDAMIEIASDMGMYAIIDYHPVGGYDEADAIDWWSVLASRYKDRTHVIYEITNEPAMWTPSVYNANLIQYQADMYTLIRAQAPDTALMLWTFPTTASSPNPAKTMLGIVDQAPAIQYTNAVVAYHPYPAYVETAINELRDAGYPIFNSEIGGGLRQDYIERTNQAETLNVSWIGLDGTEYGKNFANDPLPVSWTQDPLTGRPSVIDPIISPNGGTFANEVTVNIDTSTLNDEIYYTLDGTDPVTTSLSYTGEFSLTTSGTTVVKYGG